MKSNEDMANQSNYIKQGLDGPRNQKRPSRNEALSFETISENGLCFADLKRLREHIWRCRYNFVATITNLLEEF